MLITTSASSLTSPDSALAIIGRLREFFPEVQFDEVVGVSIMNFPGGAVAFEHLEKGEPKLKIDLRGLEAEDAAQFWKQLKQIFEDDTGVTFNGGITTYAGLNIPTRLLDQLDEGKAEEVAGIIREAMELSNTRIAYKNLLEQVSGVNVNRTGRDYSKDDRRPCYVITYPVDGYTDPIKHIHQALNKALGEELFEGITMEGGRHHLLIIMEEDMPEFLQNPNRANAVEIFHSPEAKCTEFRRSTWVGKMEARYDKLTGHERKEKPSYKPVREGDIALPDDFKRRTPDAIKKLGAGNTTQIGPDAAS